MDGLKRWLRATFDYNPTFPLSALLLMAGLAYFDRDGRLVMSTVEGVASGLGLLQLYEVLLLGVALWVLWPRRIAYETTAILIVVGVVRYASPFLVIGLGAEGHPVAASVLGAGLWGLMMGKGVAIQGGVRWAFRRWERGLDAVYLGVASVGFPWVAYLLAEGTGAWLSHGAARWLQVLAWWGLAVALAPLARGVEGLGEAGALRSRRSALVWRGLSVFGLASLLGSTLWLSGSGPTVYALLPWVWVVLAVLSALARACGQTPWAAWAWTPALGLAFVTWAPSPWLWGRLPLCSAGTAWLSMVPLALGAALWIDPARRVWALRAVGGVLATAPLALAPAWLSGLHYALVVLVALAAVGAARRDDALLGWASVGAMAVGVGLVGLRDAGLVSVGGGAALALVVAWRRPSGATALEFAAAALFVGGLWEAGLGVQGGLGWAVLAAGAAASLPLRWRVDASLHAVCGSTGLVVGVGRDVAPRVWAAVDPGVAMVVLAFVAIPVGTAIALRRERAAAEELL